MQKLLWEEHGWRRQGGQDGGGLLILMARLEAAHDIIAAGCGSIAAATAGTAPDHLLDKGGLEFSSVHHRPRAGERGELEMSSLTSTNASCCYLFLAGGSLAPLALLVWK